MSATGRNLVGHERRADDFYATPAWCTRAILPWLAPIPESRRGRALDPCSGEGAILRVLELDRPSWIRQGIEIDEGRARVCGVSKGDALVEPWPMTDLVITNPPYALAFDFVQRAAQQCPHADRAFLLRLNFLGSRKRASWLRSNTPDVFVLPRRPSFTNGGTDATEYSWMIWGPGRIGIVRILDAPAGARRGRERRRR